MPRLKVALLAMLLCAAAAPPAMADGEVTKLVSQADAARLEGWAKSRAQALNEASAAGDPAERRILDEVLADGPLFVRGATDLAGDWRCRVIKLGGTLPLVVYGWFSCRISDDGSGWRLEKLTGSQRTTGRFFDDTDIRLIYLGAGHYDYEQPRTYAADSEHNQVAYLFRPEPDRLRMEFPAPRFESTLDILDLRR